MTMILVSFLDVSVLITVIAKNIIELTVDNCRNMKQNTVTALSNGFMSQINSYVNKGRKFNFNSADPDTGCETLPDANINYMVTSWPRQVRLPTCVLKMATV